MHSPVSAHPLSEPMAVDMVIDSIQFHTPALTLDSTRDERAQMYLKYAEVHKHAEHCTPQDPAE